MIPKKDRNPKKPKEEWSCEPEVMTSSNSQSKVISTSTSAEETPIVDLPILKLKKKTNCEKEDFGKKKRKYSEDEERKSKKKKKKRNSESNYPEETFSLQLSISDLNQQPKVLTRKSDGFFYQGKVVEIAAPDIYGIVLDHERGHKPHIYSREEILLEAVSLYFNLKTKLL